MAERLLRCCGAAEDSTQIAKQDSPRRLSGADTLAHSWLQHPTRWVFPGVWQGKPESGFHPGGFTTGGKTKSRCISPPTRGRPQGTRGATGDAAADSL